MRRGKALLLGGLIASSALGIWGVHLVGAPTVAGHAAAILGPRVALAAADLQGWTRRGGLGLRTACGDHRDERLDAAMEFADAFLRIEPHQAQAWSRLEAALRAGSARIGKACRTLDAGGFPKTAPDKLARVEMAMVAGLDVVRGIRPAFEAFYATLSDQQKSALDGLFEHRRR